jgi:hypothetical protein
MLVEGYSIARAYSKGGDAVVGNIENLPRMRILPADFPPEIVLPNLIYFPGNTLIVLLGIGNGNAVFTVVARSSGGYRGKT